MKKRGLNVIGTIIIIIFLPVLIINLILIIKSYLNQNDIPTIFGFKPFIVLSGSMEPTIMTGDIAIIKDIKPEELKVGDIIAFRSGKSVITHRIIEINNEEEELITKGDNNNTEDRYPVSFSNVEGLYYKRIPKLGNFAMFLQTTTGTIIFISIPFAIFIINDLIQKKKETKIQAQKQKKLEEELEELKKERKR